MYTCTSLKCFRDSFTCSALLPTPCTDHRDQETRRTPHREQLEADETNRSAKSHVGWLRYIKNWGPTTHSNLSLHNVSRMLALLASLGFLFSLASAAPKVQLGITSIVGRDIPSLHQEFFGGNVSRASQPPIILTSFQGYPTRNRQLDIFVCDPRS
jgi:hypothetical protein